MVAMQGNGSPRHRTQPRQALVVGVPRSGFSLLISVLTECCMRTGVVPTRRQRVLRAMERDLGGMIADRIDAALNKAGCRDRLVFNDNFRRLVGGPRWLDERNPGRVCFRKYIGVRGIGDFTLVTSHPAGVLEADQVVHSHSGASAWPALEPFARCERFASVRNPFGVLNSSVFSINALASEYIQKYLPPSQDTDALRQRLAAYKLTDLKFFRSLVQHLKRELEAYLPERGQYAEMQWEDLIHDPIPTIRRLSGVAGAPVDTSVAEAIWRDLAHRNLTGAHRHNYRQGYGKVGNWRSWLIEEHLQLIRDAGLAPTIEALGYSSEEHIDPAAHTAFQREVKDALDNGRVVDDTADRDLFTFAFNKTNIDFAKFGFRMGEWRESTRMERSSMRDPTIEERVADAAEPACVALNRFLGDLLPVDLDSEGAAALVKDVFANHAESLSRLAPRRFEAARGSMADALRPPRRSMRSWLRAIWA